MTCQLCETCPFVTKTIPDKIYYEIHITVDHRDTFVEDCYELGIKPIIIDLGEDIPTQDMTSITIRGGSDTATLATANNFASIFSDKGYEVKRVKIETVPWHPKASNPEPNQYFETHFAIKNQGDNYLLNEILKYSEFLHRSRNLLKKGEDKYQMITYRANAACNEHYLEDVDYISFKLRDAGLILDKVISEFTLYDTNEEMDDQWLKKKRNV